MLTFPVGHRSTPCELVQSLASLLRPAFVAANGGCGFQNDMVKKWLVNAGETWKKTEKWLVNAGETWDYIYIYLDTYYIMGEVSIDGGSPISGWFISM